MDQLDLIGKILEGYWIGKIEDDIVEEGWSIPSANSIMGMFKWIKEGKNYFYEFIIIEKMNDKIELKIKHFNPDFEGWEEKSDFVCYRLLEVSTNKIVFGPPDPDEKGRLIYEKPDDNSLVAILEMSQTGKILKFTFNRKSI
jgi:hypothetical protein